MSRLRTIAGTVIGLMLSGCATTASPADELAALRTLDQHEKEIVAARDVSAMDALAHPSLLINAPVNRVLTREQLMERLSNGEIAAEQFDRVPEAVRISGNVGIVMGRETFTPVASSELGRIYGATALQRRYTNIYIREEGRWKWIARHAHVVPPR